MNVPLPSRDLVLQLERAEATYSEAKLRALAADNDNSRGIEIVHMGDSSLLSIQSRRNNPSMNRAMGFTTGDLVHLDEILAWLRSRSDYFWFDVAPALVDDAVLKALADTGLYPAFFLSVVYAPLQASQSPSPTGIVVHEIDLREGAHDFCAAFSEGFGIPPELIESTERSVQIEYSATGWRIYLATVDGQPAAMATLYVDVNTSMEASIASIDAMATAPRYRRRGCQSALLKRCIVDAAQAGCTLLASQTRPSSGSERNMVRAGFQIAYTKLLYAPRKPGTGV